MDHPEVMIPAQMEREIAEAHAADLRRLGAKPLPRFTPRRPHLGPVLIGWTGAPRALASYVRRHRRLVEHTPCAS